jgi:hypothetical protein
MKDFESYAVGKMFWSREREIVCIKIYIQQYLNLPKYLNSPKNFNLPKPEFRMIQKIFNNRLVFDKNIFNFIIEHAMPGLIESNLKNIIPINSLNLNSEKYSKWFTDLEKSIFSECGIIAAGSSVLTCITDKKFKPNDIDLYINVEKLEHLIKSGIFKISNCSDTLMKNNYNMKNIVKVVDIKTTTKIFVQIGCEKTFTKKYQLIVVDNDPIEFIKANFDFDLCTIAYSFTSDSFVNVIDKSDYSVLKIQPSYINKMCGTETDSYSEYRAKKTFERIQKYLSRGFYIENWREFLEEIRDKMNK